MAFDLVESEFYCQPVRNKHSCEYKILEVTLAVNCSIFPHGKCKNLILITKLESHLFLNEFHFSHLILQHNGINLIAVSKCSVMIAKKG